jgi:hypothetical protein
MNNEHYKKALEEIVETVRLDAFAFNELAAKVHEIALTALNTDETIDCSDDHLDCGCCSCYGCLCGRYDDEGGTL